MKQDREKIIVVGILIWYWYCLGFVFIYLWKILFPIFQKEMKEK